jgi:hypothetical protein
MRFAIEYRLSPIHCQAFGQNPGVGTVQDDAQGGDLLNRFHPENDAVFLTGRAITGVDVQQGGACLLTGASRFLEGMGIQSLQGNLNREI